RLCSTPCHPLFFSSFSFFMLPPPPSSTLFPYTTLFRSANIPQIVLCSVAALARVLHDPVAERYVTRAQEAVEAVFAARAADHHRSEEHTSELQSRENLVCRLLLEKKKKKKISNTASVHT